jgi:putative membrane protein
MLAAVGYWGWGWWFWAFWIFIILVALWEIPWHGRRHQVRPPEEQILRERYARGEITKQEFDQKRHDLRRAA